MGSKDKETMNTTKGNLRRRSSVGRSIRRSQSGPAGITFEQQLSASIQGNGTITTEEKFEKVISLSLKEALKSLQQENEQMEMDRNRTTEDITGDTIDHLVDRLSRQSLLSDENIKILSAQTIKFCTDESASNNHSHEKVKRNTPIVSTRLRMLNQYQDSLDKEINDWDELLQQRKNKYNFARLEYQEVSNGTQKITNKHRTQLPRLEDAWLRGVSDGRAEFDRLEKQKVMIKLCEKQIQAKMSKKRKLLQDNSAELDVIAKSVYDTAAKNMNAFESHMSDKSFKLTDKLEEQSHRRNTSEANFAKEVKDWFQEMQNS